MQNQKINDYKFADRTRANNILVRHPIHCIRRIMYKWSIFSLNDLKMSDVKCHTVS